MRKWDYNSYKTATGRQLASSGRSLQKRYVPWKIFIYMRVKYHSLQYLVFVIYKLSELHRQRILGSFKGISLKKSVSKKKRDRLYSAETPSLQPMT